MGHSRPECWLVDTITPHERSNALSCRGSLYIYVYSVSRCRSMARRKLQAHLELETEFGALLGGTRIRLLEAVDKHGSISKAAKAIPMSYKAAWDALEDLNNLADQPVIE